MPRPVRCRYPLLGAAAFLIVALELVPARATDGPVSPPAPPAAAAPAATEAGPVTELLQIEAAARALDPAAPDAVAHLRELLARLARVSAQLASEQARLRQTHAAANAPRPASPAKPAVRRGGATAAGKPSPSAAAAKPGDTPTSAGFFAKRGLKKFHRPGCQFGERVKTEERVYFARPADAVAAGLEPCKVCRPGE
jgi:hypothetical protein